MKKILAIMAIVAIGFTSCKKDDNAADPGSGGTGGTTLTVEKVNKALLIDFTEDWCGPCGDNGGPAFDSLLGHESTKLHGMKVYRTSNNSSLNWSTGQGLWNIYTATAWGGTGVPKFIAGNAYQGVGSLNGTVSSVLTKVNTFNNGPVIAGIALNKSIEGDTMRVTTKTKFFVDQLPGTDIRIALYVVEGLLLANQYTSGGNVANYEHHNVTRTSNGTTYTGLQINSTAAITANQEFDNSFSMYLKPGWNKNNLKVIAVIWKMNSNPPIVLNSNMIE